MVEALISVIIPTHNRMALLEQTLRSLEKQTDQDFEVIIAIDGSTDGTLALIESFKRHNSLNLREIWLEHAGSAKARNEAIKQARGETLLFCDDDLVLEENVIAEHRAFHEIYKNHIALGQITFVYPNGKQKSAMMMPNWVRFSGVNVSLLRKIALEIGLFDQNLAGYGGEDLEFGYRLYKAGQHFKVLKSARVFHQGPAGNSPEKAFSAGYQAYKIAKKHGNIVAWQLGVHPILLNIKKLYLNPFFNLIFGKKSTYSFEYNYQKGVIKALIEDNNQG